MRISLKKEMPHLSRASAKAVVAVDVPAMNFLMLDGEGNPNTAPTASLAGGLYAPMQIDVTCAASAKSAAQVRVMTDSSARAEKRPSDSALRTAGVP